MNQRRGNTGIEQTGAFRKFDDRNTSCDCNAQAEKDLVTILLVEDDLAVRSVVRLVLRHYGYRVLEAASAAEALDVWAQERQKIDLLLTDLSLPDSATGWDIAERLKSEQPRLKVVVTSGFISESVEDACASKEGFNFIQKPYSHSELAGILRECLE